MDISKNFEFLSFLGKEHGVVKLCQDKRTKEKVAIKILERKKIMDKEDQKLINTEIEIIKKFHHINIIRVKKILKDS